ncbi:MAG TPA: 2-C-methyl-D-erythritol 4-phosphate cytidylyltransferase [Pyrinomonadaceae bacterium]|nr:2-C-methyl-D-erythritol 4-phosphate cytidylyltransferase [Pyrinomonadaceae bacterium]
MNVAIIAAAGQGSRMGGKRAKQFLELAGIPVIFHTLRPFEQCEVIQEIIVVVPAPEVAGFLSRAGKRPLRKVTRVVPGGATRAESVQRGLQAVLGATAGVIAVHDGVRPFVTPDEIARTVRAAEESEAAILVAPVTDTIKEVSEGKVIRTMPRSQLRRALTPQCFRYDLLRRAYDKVDISDPELTDDSFLVERLGVKVVTVAGSALNIKITTPSDLVLAEALLKESVVSSQ